jgi:cytochrome b
LVEEVHAFFGNLFVPLVVLHVGGVIFTSIRQKENLVAAMIHGRKIVDD